MSVRGVSCVCCVCMLNKVGLIVVDVAFCMVCYVNLNYVHIGPPHGRFGCHEGYKPDAIFKMHTCMHMYIINTTSSLQAVFVLLHCGSSIPVTIFMLLYV